MAMDEVKRESEVLSGRGQGVETRRVRING
jgi:hypothetical protein